MTIKIELLTTDVDEIELAERYWATDETGEYLEKVSDLLPFRDIPEGATLSFHIRRICRAFDDNQICPSCEGFLEIPSRNYAKRVRRTARKPCISCQKTKDKLTQSAYSKAAKRSESQLSKYADMMASRVVDYCALPDDVVLLLLALNRIIKPGLVQGHFRLADCRAFALGKSRELIHQLCAAHALVEVPELAPQRTYLPRKGMFYLQPEQIVYRLTPDLTHGRSEQAFDILVQRVFSDDKRLFQLWIQYATAAAMVYLASYLKENRFYLELPQISDIETTLTSALHVYSIKQLWFVIWKTIRDANSLAAHEDYSPAKACASIPEKLRRYLDQAINDNLAVPSENWHSPDHQAAGSLGLFFSELFDFNEYTPGTLVRVRLSRLNGQAPTLDNDPEFAQRVSRFMTCALANDRGPTAMLEYGELIRNGLDAASAMDAVSQTMTEEERTWLR